MKGFIGIVLMASVLVLVFRLCGITWFESLAVLGLLVAFFVGALLLVVSD